MTLAELHDRLAPSFSPSVRKDLQTAVRVLASALQCPDPQHCPLDKFNRPFSALSQIIEIHLSSQGKSAHTIRNTKNNLSRLFRLAEQHHLFSLLPTPITAQYDYLNMPQRPGTPQHKAAILSYAHWPSDLQDTFTAFTTWATDAIVAGRDAYLKKRQSTVRNYRAVFEGYFGFLHHIQQLPALSFDQLFDITLLTQYIHWHINDCHKRSTASIERFFVIILALARQYHPLPDLCTQLVTLRRTIPKSHPVYNKEDAWVSLATLEEIARSIWPHKQPQAIRDDGTQYAARAGLSLMLRLWVYIPYRQRNMREMALGTNLHKDSQGKWRITFRGEQLKIASKRGRLNVFDMPFPENLVPVLEEYLSVWRPLLLQRSSQPSTHVFLTRYSGPWEVSKLCESTKRVVYRYTGKHWHPHIIRTVWASEWIRKTHGDFYTAAVMLNDKLETVIKNYAHLMEEDVAEKAFRLIDERNGNGH